MAAETKRHPAIPDPLPWWDDPVAGTLVGSREDGLLAVMSDGALDGPATVFKDGEPLVQSHWRDNVLHGPQTVWRPPFYRTGEFVDGKPHGRWTLYWREHELVWNEYDAGKVVGAARVNEISRDISSKTQFIVNGQSVGSMDDVLAMGDAVQTLGFGGWQEPTLPEGLWELSSLRELQIYFSQVRPIPAGIGELTNLELLEIKGCNIGTVDPAIGKLQKLREVRILNSGLGVFPAVASPALTSMDLSGNIMSRVGHSLAGCPALTTLKMRDSYIMTLDENVFSAPNLRMLDMTGSFWVSWISPAVGDARKLVNLTLYEQCLHALPAEELSECAELQTLNLYGAHLIRPPMGLDGRAIGQLNLDNTPLHVLPGHEDFEDALQRRWARVDEHVAARVALDDLSLESLDLHPPKAIDAIDLSSRPNGSVWRWGYEGPAEGGEGGWTSDAAVADHPDFESMSALASEVRSGAFSCESGDHPVQVVLGPPRAVDVPLTERLMDMGVLTPCDPSRFHEMAVRLEGSPLVETLSAMAPCEAWALEVLPDSEHDLKLAVLVLQLDDDVWAAVGPTLDESDTLRPTPDALRSVEPNDGKLRELLMREIARTGGAQLCFHGLERRVGGPSTLVFEDTRHRVLAKYLVSAGACAVRDFDGQRFDEGEPPMPDLGAALRDLDSPQELMLGGVAIHHRMWLGRSSRGEVVGVETQTVMT